jgi:hypothetical protein
LEAYRGLGGFSIAHPGSRRYSYPYKYSEQLFSDIAVVNRRIDATVTNMLHSCPLSEQMSSYRFGPISNQTKRV